MSLHFEKIRVKSIRRETEDCISIAFDIPESLQEKFGYTAGQHITLRTFINGEEQRRSYSLCSSPYQKEWRVAVKKVESGIFSTFANEQLTAGDELELMPPMGHFTIHEPSSLPKNYLAIAAGSGITPVISLIRTILATEAGSSVTLIYGNKTRHSIIFREELEALKDKYINRFRIVHILSRERTDAAVNSGRINAEKLGELKKLVNYAQYDNIFICGPEAMIFTAKTFLEEQQIAPSKIHFELFTTPGQVKTNTAKQTNDTEDSGPKSNITVKLDGRAFDFSLPFSSATSILDAALKQGADLPFACKGGVCCTCKAKLTEGEISMDVCYGLEHEEVEQGFILTCQSHPQSEKVVIDFDIR